MDPSGYGGGVEVSVSRCVSDKRGEGMMRWVMRGGGWRDDTGSETRAETAGSHAHFVAIYNLLLVSSSVSLISLPIIASDLPSP